MELAEREEKLSQWRLRQDRLENVHGILSSKVDVVDRLLADVDVCSC